MTTVFTTNKHARFDYEILETLEAGIALTGGEVKSVKNNQVTLQGAYITIRNGEAFLRNCQISHYKMAGKSDEYNPLRVRKLLLHFNELLTLSQKSDQAGLTILPLSLYSRNNKIKVEVAIARGKKKYDKRETIKKRESDRESRAAMRSKY